MPVSLERIEGLRIVMGAISESWNEHGGALLDYIENSPTEEQKELAQYLLQNFSLTPLFEIPVIVDSIFKATNREFSQIIYSLKSFCEKIDAIVRQDLPGNEASLKFWEVIQSIKERKKRGCFLGYLLASQLIPYKPEGVVLMSDDQAKRLLSELEPICLEIDQILTTEIPPILKIQLAFNRARDRAGDDEKKFVILLAYAFSTYHEIQMRANPPHEIIMAMPENESFFEGEHPDKSPIKGFWEEYAWIKPGNA